MRVVPVGRVAPRAPSAANHRLSLRNGMSPALQWRYNFGPLFKFESQEEEEE